MAGMFYTLQEVAEKLNKTEEEVKEIVKKGKLREFRDGPDLLFKVDEVEALMSDTSIMPPQVPAVPSEPEPTVPFEQEPAVPSEPEPGIPLEPEPVVPSEPEPAAPPQPEEEISLAPESAEAPAPASELTSADTALAGEGVSVLGETDRDYQVTEDTMAETKAVPSEASLEEIEEDVSLDSFGSGSGLLDLSLQADDTSLGGILDEIYTPETGEGKQAAEPGSAIEMAVEAEQMLTEEGFAAPQPAPEIRAMARAYIEPEPDTQSNTLGILLFLPLLAIVYTAIVAVAGFNNIMPAILEKIQAYIWYIMIGAGVVAVVIIVMAFMLGSKGPKAAKRPKAKRAKKTRKKAPKNATA